MALRTYGDKPLSFQLEEGGEYYYVGSEVNDACTIHKLHMNNKKNHSNDSRSVTIYDYFVDHCTKNIRECQDEH